MDFYQMIVVTTLCDTTLCLKLELGVPSSVDLVCSEPAHLVTSFTNGQIGLFNMETSQLVLSLESNLEPGTFRFN